ncbi:MAG: hypothetical protein ABSE85_17715 [Candidatus Korobacteraceae bacterium]
MPVFGQIGGEFQSVGFGDGHQFLGKLVTCELILVGDSRQLQPIQFFVLPHQHVVGAGEHRSPAAQPYLVVTMMCGKEGCRPQHGMTAVHLGVAHGTGDSHSRKAYGQRDGEHKKAIAQPALRNIRHELQLDSARRPDA